MKKQAKPGRYIVLLKDDTKTTINKVQKELDLKLTSSEELNSKVRSFNIMSKDNGIVYKNLGVAVVDDIEEAKIKAAANATDRIVYFEKEREFYAIDEIEQLEELKKTSDLLREQIEELQKLLENNNGIDKTWDNATWGTLAIDLPKSKYTGKNVNVAILDTGFYASHPDFQNRNMLGRTFIHGEAWDDDGNGHGTHCAGTAVGNISLSSGTRYGVAPEANMIIGKVLSDAGSGSTSGILDAIDWALEKGAQVISMSLGSPVNVGQPPSFMFEHVGKRALQRNCLLIAAAGNDSSRPDVPRPVSSPANANSIMAIGALNSALEVAWFSNGGINASNGGRIDLAAPGVEVYSSYSPNASGNLLYRKLNGTSMATPHVAGLAALYFQAFPSLSAEEIWNKLTDNAKDLSPLLFRDVGFGLAQAV